MKKPQKNPKGKRNFTDKKDFSTKEKFAKKTKNTVEENNDVAYGYHAVVEVLKQGKVNKLFLQEDLKGSNVETIKELAQQLKVPVKWAPKSKLEELTNGGIHQGFVAMTTPYAYLTLTELLEKTTTENPFYLLLDGLEDPHNLGSILRSADAAGVDGIILPKHRAVGVTPTVVKTSTGAVEYVPIARVTNLHQAIESLKEAGFWIFGTDMVGTSYDKWQATGKIALIIGNEGSGISPSIKKDVDEMLTIPMTGHVQSLNASVAAAILMFEAAKQRAAL